MTPERRSEPGAAVRSSRMDPRLVFDVGANNGDDTAHYLRQGYRVVSIEADPAMVEVCAVRFAEEIANGTLLLLNLAIAEREGPVSFYVSQGNRGVWSSLDYAEAARGGMQVREVQVPGVRFASVIEKYGAPYFLKIDIEGRDYLCLRDLTPDTSPPFLSFEANEGSLADLLLLSHLGYTHFKLINQMRGFTAVSPPALHTLSMARQIVLNDVKRRVRRVPMVMRLLRMVGSLRSRRTNGEARGAQFSVSSSGPMGPSTPGRWMTLEEVTYAWLYFVKRTTDSDWFDVHAALPDPPVL